MMSGSRIAANSTGQIPLDNVVAQGVHNEADVGALASQDNGTVSIFIWHYHDNYLPMSDASINLTVAGLPWSSQYANVTHYRLDNEHSNSYARWLAIGSPAKPNSAQYADLKAAGALQTWGPPAVVDVLDGGINISFTLPIFGMSLITVEKLACQSNVTSHDFASTGYDYLYG